MNKKTDEQKFYCDYTCRICGSKSSTPSLAQTCFDLHHSDVSACCLCQKEVIFDCGFVGATKITINPKYGSRHDGRHEIRVVCDECLTKIIGENDLPF